MTMHFQGERFQDGNDSANDGAIDKYRSALRGRVGDAKYQSWFADLALDELSDGCVILSTASSVKKEMIDSRWLPMMKETWCVEIGPIQRMRLTVRRELRKQAAKIDARECARGALAQPKPFGAEEARAEKAFSVAKGASAADKSADKKAFDFRDLSTPVDARKNFASFAVDDTNRMAWAAAQQVFVEGAPRELVYFFGPSGVGKTHVAQAVANRWKAEGDRGEIAYITYSNLINGCVNAVWSNSIHAMHQALLDNDLLIVDDIHLLDTKSRTQEELLNAVDAFIARGKQVVIAGELAPAKLREAGICQRLADRLAGGLCAPIQHATETLRCDVLKKRLDQKTAACSLSDEAVEFIARNFHQSMRETIGAMNQILVMHQNEDVTVGVDETKALLKLRLADRKRVVTMEDLIEAGAAAFGITPAEVLGRGQPQRLVRGRHAIVFCAREILKESFPRIGKALGRDHTTVMSSYRRAQALLERDKAFQDGVAKIREIVGA